MHDDKQQVAAITTTSGHYEGPERRLDRDEWRDGVNQRLADGTARMGRIEGGLSDMREVQASIIVTQARVEAKQDANNADTAEMLEIIRMGKGFFRAMAAFGRGLLRVAKWLRTILMWALPLATAILTFWYTLTGHGPTK